MTLDHLNELINAGAYTTVDSHLTSSGELCLMLSHRITMDDAVLIRVRVDHDVIYITDEERWEVVNQGGDWPEAIA